MTCPSEFTCELYADGELDRRQSEGLAAHLDGCSDCRNLVRALESESRLLAYSLHEGAELSGEPITASKPASRRLGLGRVAAGLVGMAFLLRLGLAAILNVDFPRGFDWLHPFSLAGGVNWLANGFFYFVNDGGSMIVSYLNQLSLLVFNLVVATGLILMAHRLRPARVVLGLGTLLIALALPGYAIDVRRPGPNERGAFVVGPGEVVDDTLVVFGESITVEGTVTGDLIAFVQRVDIEGTVEGNVVTFAQTVDVSGSVAGDVIGFSQSLRIAGRVGQNLWGFGQSVDVADTGSTEGNVIVFGAQANMNGGVGRDLMVAGGTLNVDGQVGGDIDFRGGRVTVRAPAIVGGGVLARVPQEENMEIEAGATIAGERTGELPEPGVSDYARVGYYVGQVIRLAAAFVTALLLFWLFPGLGNVDLNSARSLLTSVGIGFLAVVATPIAALIAAITLIGLPLALLGVGLWLWQLARDGGSVQVVEIPLPRLAGCIGSTVADIGARLPADSLLISIRRAGGEVVFPHGATRFEEGDTLVACARGEHVRELRAVFADT